MRIFYICIITRVRKNVINFGTILFKYFTVFPILESDTCYSLLMRCLCEIHPEVNIFKKNIVRSFGCHDGVQFGQLVLISCGLHQYFYVRIIGPSLVEIFIHTSTDTYYILQYSNETPVIPVMEKLKYMELINCITSINNKAIHK